METSESKFRWVLPATHPHIRELITDFRALGSCSISGLLDNYSRMVRRFQDMCEWIERWEKSNYKLVEAYQRDKARCQKMAGELHKEAMEHLDAALAHAKDVVRQLEDLRGVMK